MTPRPMRWRFFSLAIALVWLPSAPARAQESPANTVTVAATFDNRPFSYQVGVETRRTGCRVLRLTYPSPVISALPQNNTVPALLFLPDDLKPGDPKRPAVICLPILNGDEDLTDMVCSVLVARGIPALMFKLPYYGERGPPEGRRALAANPKIFVEAIEQAGADIRRTADLLAARPEIDAQRLGITGISLGGIMAATSAGADPRFYRASLLLAGGDLLKIIHHTRETRQLSDMLKKLPEAERVAVEAKLKAIDPLTHAAKLHARAAQGHVLMLNASVDEVIPRECTEKLADALGISQQVVWFEGLGHYTAMAELPRALRLTADFFAQDLPPGVKPTVPVANAALTPLGRVMSFAWQAVTMLTTEPAKGHCHFFQAELAATNKNGQVITGQARLAVGVNGKFSLWAKAPEFGEISAGQGAVPWLMANKSTDKLVFIGTKNPGTNTNPFAYVDPQHVLQFRVIAGAAASVTLVPDLAQRWINAENDRTFTNGDAVRITAKDARKMPGSIRLEFAQDGRTPTGAEFDLSGAKGRLRIQAWQTNTIAVDLFEPPAPWPRREVSQDDLHRMFGALLNFAGERVQNPGRDKPADTNAPTVVARDPANHGLLCRLGRKNILLLAGTPAEMGAAHGALAREPVRRTVERVVYGVGGLDTIKSGEWFLDTLAGIEQRTQPHLPKRFLEECDALADAAGLARRDVRYANLFPERFHCTGVALRGKATVGGQVLHARVLDYMRDAGLQNSAMVTVFMPKDGHKWLSAGYAGFIGTVTAMNEKGVAIGEMGGKGQGLWDGLPMSFLLREVMERAATVEEALAIIRKTPRTCEYYYVISDKSGTLRSLYCLPDKMVVREPGQQDPELAPIPDDTVFISGEVCSKTLSARLFNDYGKIDAARLMEIIKRPVALRSNLHDAIFAPQTLEMWLADAGRNTPACDEPYTHVKLDELIRFYHQEILRGRN